MINNAAARPVEHITLKHITLAVATALGLMSSAIHADNVATQLVSMTVTNINEIEVAGGTVSLTIDTATAGSAPTSDVDSTTATYSISTNSQAANSKKITAAINTAMPTGLTLNVLLAAPAGATATARNLSTTAADVVEGIEAGEASGLAITYTLSALITAAPTTSAVEKTVTYTLTDT